MWAHRDRGSRHRACKGLPLVCIYVMAVSLVCGLSNSESGVPLLPTFGTVFPLLGCLVPPQYESFALFCSILEACSFLKRIGGGVQLGEMGDRKSGGRGNCGWDDCMREESIFNLKNCCKYTVYFNQSKVPALIWDH